MFSFIYIFSITIILNLKFNSKSNSETFVFFLLKVKNWQSKFSIQDLKGILEKYQSLIEIQSENQKHEK